MKKLLIATSILVILDQISKIIIRSLMTLSESITVIPSFLNITYVQNTGAAFSILEGKQWFFIIVSLVVLIAFIYYLKNKSIDKFDIVIFSLILSGIIGNLIDRIFLNYVTDFIEFILFSKNMPVFNLADTFICVGCFLLIFKEDLCKSLNILKKKVKE